MPDQLRQQKIEQTIRVFVAFFAALIGFGLKRLLDDHTLSQDLAEDHWPAFIVAVLLFVRFLSGAANHLWYVHAYEQNASVKRFYFDLLFLIVFGIFAAYITYAPSSESFFWRMGVFLAVSSVWAVIDLRLGGRSFAFWFLVTDLIHLVGVVLAGWLLSQNHPRFEMTVWNYTIDVSWPWIVLVAFSAILLLADLGGQLRSMKLTQQTTHDR